MDNQFKKKKVVFIVNYIPHYRLKLFQLLGEYYDLTVVHWGQDCINELSFKQIVLSKVTFFNFFFYKKNIYKLTKGYDVVICLADLKVIQCILLGFYPFKKYKLIFWGIGVSASYNKKFDDDRRFDKLRYFLLNRANALIFYSEYPVKKYLNLGCVAEKLFVANNTVFVQDRILAKQEKEYLLFVGTLYKQKGIYDLLEAYYRVQNEFNSLPQLIIVGDGPEKLKIENWIIRKNISNLIILKGEITDTVKLRQIYNKAIVCISPNQAGLTVLASMAHGVPFVTSKDAITGGEIFNIKNGENGILYDGSVNELVNVIKFILNNPSNISEMSSRAQDYYFYNRKMSNMLEGFIKAIQYVLKNNK
jgi:glycosyltransferase involved in cell wall biosynthesis